MFCPLLIGIRIGFLPSKEEGIAIFALATFLAQSSLWYLHKSKRESRRHHNYQQVDRNIIRLLKWPQHETDSHEDDDP